ncbi:LysE family translocator [Agarivorans sp. Z349TD_8]|uniref:LysE family translocator n=1 Tax=Agarivorans sp. Z349TD_8 TaxID=3421434 RepID=UPI003D7D421A
MIDVSILPLFLVSIGFLAISPGPDMLLISTYSSITGFKAGLIISLGIFLAGLIQTGLVAFGLGQLMQALPPLVIAIKVVGAIYLSWLGIKLLRGWLQDHNHSSSPKILSLNNKQLLSRGLFNNLMNPKALLFFSMFLPQFTHPQQNLTTQILLLGVLLSSVVLLINIIFSLSFSKLGKLFANGLKFGRHADGLLGLIFLGLAARLISSK